MLIFWRLVLAHLISDFTLQLNVVNRLKRSVWWGMAVHVGTHLALSLALVWPYLGDVWFRVGPLRLSGWGCLAAIMVLHWLQDYWRIFAIRKFNTADGTIHFLWDQFIHLGTLFVFSPLFGFQQSGSFVPEKWAALCAIFVLVTHFTTVLVYFIEKDFYKEEFPAFDEKYLGMGLRAVLWLLFLVPGWQWTAFLALWLGYMVYLWKKRVVDFSHAGIYVGLGLTVLLGAAARRIYL